jgi:hypothetical protein
MIVTGDVQILGSVPTQTTKFCTVAFKYLCVLSIEIVLYHPSATKNFEMVLRKICASLIITMHTYHKYLICLY